MLFGLGDPGTARAVRDAHDRAVESALEYAERHAVWSRRDHGGVEQIRGDGLIAAAFRHRTSRNGDPHLHTHVLVPDMVLGADGEWATLDGRWIYTGAKTIGYLYEAQLRHNRTESLGVEWGPVVHGIGDIASIAAHVLRAFSTRRAEIEERMDIRGQHSPQAAMIAALDTRKAKGRDLDPVLLRDAWTAKAHESGFDRNDILRAWCDALPAGASIEELDRLADAFVNRLGVAPLTGVRARGPVIRDRNRAGAVVAAGRGAVDHVRSAQRGAAGGGDSAAAARPSDRGERAA